MNYNENPEKYPQALPPCMLTIKDNLVISSLPDDLVRDLLSEVYRPVLFTDMKKNITDFMKKGENFCPKKNI